MLYIGSSDTPSYTLDEVTFGMIIGRMGNPGPLSKKNVNFFTSDADLAVMDNGTKTVVYQEQKPLSLLKEVICLFSDPGDWILSGPTGIGMYGIHYMHKSGTSILKSAVATTVA